MKKMNQMIQKRQKTSPLKLLDLNLIITKVKTSCQSLAWGFCVVLCSVSFQVHSSIEQAQTDITELLQQADKQKSSNSEAAFKIIEQIKQNSDSLDSEQKEYLLYLDSYKKAYQGEFEEAIQGYKSIIEKSSNNEIKFRAKISLANIFGIIRNYSESFQNLQSLVEDIPNIENLEYRQQGLAVAAFNYNSFQNYQQALLYADKLLAEKPEGRNLCFAKQLKTEASFHLKPSINLDDLEEDAVFCESINELIAASLLQVLKARFYLENNEPVKAVEHLLNNQELVKKSEYPSILARYYIVFARAKWALKDLDEAEKYANKVLDIVDGEEYIKSKVFAYSLLHEIAKENGDFKLALDHYVNYSESDKAQINEILAQQLAYNIVEHQTEEKVQEIKLLNKQNEVLKLEQDLAQQSAKNNKLMMVLLVFILASLAFWSYRVKRNQIKLKRQSETDLLTGVCSRPHFYAMCRKTLQYAETHKQEVSFVLFDMDKFKAVNDSYGHLVGDWVLKKAIEIAKPCWRQNDIAGRLGGEEFALMLPTCDIDKAVQIAEKCRLAIESIDTTESGFGFSVSASFGVTTSKISGYELQSLIGDADKVMYQAKDAGKNRVLRVASKS